jgi:hypothetical protein
LLAANNINLDNCSGFVANNRAILVVETHDFGRARSLLQSHSLRLLTQEQMLNL